MKCFNCGKENKSFLCDNCQSSEILDKVYNEILSFKKDNNNNPYIQKYVDSLKDQYELWNCIPLMLENFEEAVSEYYFCHYYKITRNIEFENRAINFLNSHDLKEKKTQIILYDLLNFYLRDDYTKPKKWCDLIEKSELQFVVELYAISSEYYSMIGEYELSERMIAKGRNTLKQKPEFIFSDDESMIRSFNKREELLKRYKSGKPYWPSTEERRKALAEIYDKKGIKYQRITIKPSHVAENDFKPIKEVYGGPPNKYICFWCAETYNINTIKSIYQIGAVLIENDKIIEEYQSFVKPWDGMIAKKRAANEANVDLSVIESARDVDTVMKEFITFIKDCVLVSTDALGNQAKLLTRSLRYAGFNSIENGFLDILDYASDVDSKFDLENNNRDYLLKYFNIKEGKDALDKAKANFEIIKKLKEIRK